MGVAGRLLRGVPCVLVVAGLAGACSPYVYDAEIAAFSEGVDASVATFDALAPRYIAWKTEARDKELQGRFAQGIRPSTSEGCEALRPIYESSFADATGVSGDGPSEADYAACHATPTSTIDPEAGLPRLTALGDALKPYVDGLEAISRAEDEAELQSAFTEFNTGAKSLLAAVNQELERDREEAFDTVAQLVYQVGLAYLRQRRFDALKTAVNETHPVVVQAARLLAEGAFDLYGPTITAAKAELTEAENAAVGAAPDTLLAVWTDIRGARDAYVATLRNSPIHAFKKIADTHAALRASLNDPANRDQLDAVLANAKALKKTAESTLKLVKKLAEAPPGQAPGSGGNGS